MIEAAQFLFGVVILAAGASTRMGRPKLLLPWNDTTIVEYLIGSWQRLGAAQIVVVHAENDAALTAELDRIGLPSGNRIVNASAEQGMFSSIRVAAQSSRWRSEITHVVITLGDQPHVREESLRGLIAFAAEHPNQICQPNGLGRAKHPVVLPRNAFTQLATTSHDRFDHFLAGRSDRAYLELADAGLDLDIDTPADYEAAKRHR